MGPARWGTGGPNRRPAARPLRRGPVPCVASGPSGSAGEGPAPGPAGADRRSGRSRRRGRSPVAPRRAVTLPCAEAASGGGAVRWALSPARCRRRGAGRVGHGPRRLGLSRPPGRRRSFGPAVRREGRHQADRWRQPVRSLTGRPGARSPEFGARCSVLGARRESRGPGGGWGECAGRGISPRIGPPAEGAPLRNRPIGRMTLGGRDPPPRDDGCP